MKKKEAKYHFDLDHLYISGDSAGGFLVLLIAAVQNSPQLQQYYGVSPVKKGIRGIAASCPCIDMRRILQSNALVWKIIKKYALQRDVYQNEDYLHHISAPDIFMMSDYPRVFLSTTPADNLLYEDTLHIHKLLNDLGIDHVYKEYPQRSNKLKHVFNVSCPQYEESIKANDDFLAYFSDMSK